MSDLSAYEQNCENISGVVELPVGLVKEMQVNGNKYALPIATTEACLVASANRGAKAISLCGGAISSIQRVGITRAPVFKIKNKKSQEWYENWFRENADAVQKCIKQTSLHTQWLGAKVLTDDEFVHVEMKFDTADAMGMNMATISAKRICDELLVPEWGGTLIATSGNLCSDKKASLRNATSGRGRMIKTSAEISIKVLSEVLKTTPKELLIVSEAKLKSGSRLAKAIGQNAHHANILAGVFIATGQDPSHIADGATGTTILQQTDTGIKITIEMPCILVGTVGGGTRLPTQNKWLQAIGLTQKNGTGKAADELAMVIGAGVLCAELSLLCAITSHDLASAHAQFRA